MTSPSSTEQLISQARLGDDLALGQLMESFRPYLELLSRLEIGRRLQNKVDTADLIQDTFLDAHRGFKAFRGTSEPEFTSWLRTILAGKIALMLRRYLGTQGRDIHREQPLALNLDETSQCLDRALLADISSPSQQVVKREQNVVLARAIAALSPDYRDVILLRQLEELSFTEVAERMGRSVDSVQKLWVRALAKLKLLMGEEPAM